MKDDLDRQDESEAREDSAVAVVVAAEKVEDDACDGVGEAERGSRFLLSRSSPRRLPAATAAGARGSSVTGDRYFGPPEGRERLLLCQAGRKSAWLTPPPPPYARPLPLSASVDTRGLLWEEGPVSCLWRSTGSTKKWGEARRGGRGERIAGAGVGERLEQGGHDREGIAAGRKVLTGLNRLLLAWIASNGTPIRTEIVRKKLCMYFSDRRERERDGRTTLPPVQQ